MSPLRTHLTDLETAASKYASYPAFKVPDPDPSTGQVREWVSITYEQFKTDVELFAKYWAHVLKEQGLPPRSVVGMWISGMAYTDVLHIYGVSRAGYVPQLFSLRLPSAEVIFELLQKGNAKALIYDSSHQSALGDSSPIPVHLAVNVKDENTVYNHLPDIPVVINGDETAFIFHTSGSTSGSPKLVPWSYAFMLFEHHKIDQVLPLTQPWRQRVINWTGSMCHSAQNMVLQALVPQGGCVVQPTAIDFSSEELKDMVDRCGLNFVDQFPTYLSGHLRRARNDTKLLSLLRNLDNIAYGGLALPNDDREWAAQNGITLRDMFGNTECALLMTSDASTGPYAQLLRPVGGGVYEFQPVIPEDKSEAGHQPSTRLLELVVLADSPDCPHPSLRGPDGHFHTGDLFEEMAPGIYANRGRDDDWIKSENALRCDARALEDNVRATCGDLIQECIVVGYGRPSPTLVVEALSNMDEEKLKKDIIQATRPFNSRRYMHERIVSEKMIIVVPPNSLPRTASKGNIRRRAVEEAYKTKLDEIYAKA